MLSGKDGPGLARVLAAGGFDGLQMIDPAQYDPKEVVETHQESPESYWFRIQRESRVSAYLSPTEGFIAQRDQAALADMLRLGERFAKLARRHGEVGHTFTVVPIDGRLLGRQPAWLIKAIAAHPNPVGLVLGDPTNPLDRPGAVEGLVRLLDAAPSTALLRADLSALAAVANGAWFGAIGTTSSSRHLVPPGARPGGVWGDPSPSLSVPSFVDYRRGSLLERMEDAADLLICGCAACAGSSLCRFGDPRLRDEAILHSCLSTVNLAKAILGYAEADRPAIWSRICLSALDAVAEVEERTGVPLRAHAYVRAWAGLI